MLSIFFHILHPVNINSDNYVYTWYCSGVHTGSNKMFALFTIWSITLIQALSLRVLSESGITT